MHNRCEDLSGLCKYRTVIAERHNKLAQSSIMVVEHYVYTGEGNPPRNATHVSIHDSVTIIPYQLFREHPNIIELICHIRVKKIERSAFYKCPRLKRLIMPGVEEVKRSAFYGCKAIEHLKCDKLEIIGKSALSECKSLVSIDLPSAKFVLVGAFDGCGSLTYVTFGKKLESIGQRAFNKTNLRWIKIPLKNGLFNHDDVFVRCEEFRAVGLVDEATIYETADALLLDEWKSDLNEEIDSINQILPNADAGDEYNRVGDKTRMVRVWIGRVLQKIIHYKVEHYLLLSLAAAALAEVSPNEIVINSMLSWLQLPDYAFEGEGDNRATTPAFDRELWGNTVQKEQRLIEMEGDIASLKKSNDEQADCIQRLEQRIAQLELQAAEAGGASMQNDVDEIMLKRRQRCSQTTVEDSCTHT